MTTGADPINDTHRARFLLPGLMRCGCRGAGYTIIRKDRYGCATRRHKGTCDNGRTKPAGERLVAPGLVAGFIAAFQEEVDVLRREKESLVP